MYFLTNCDYSKKSIEGPNTCGEQTILKTIFVTNLRNIS